MDITESILQEDSPGFLSYCPKTWTRYLTVMKTIVALSESEKCVMEQVEDMIKSTKALADATTLNSDILARFKREEAYEDIRPNHASFVDEDYLKKFKFAGLIIDLAYFLSQFSWKVGPLGSGKKSHSLKV
uniref:Uncharacterized protein n=1 Tax=Brassica oleracea TaxID=3712 RepID=Q2A9B7_BRAOL|nr:hypothetical protein 40.t00004 [Brassica oleracea]